MKAVIEEGEGEIPERMQLLALTEGALPRHLYTALFTQTSDGRLLTHRQLSRHLVSLWAAENQSAIDLLGRTVVSAVVKVVWSDGTIVKLLSGEYKPMHKHNSLWCGQGPIR